MQEQPIRFDDGHAYELGMGVYSRLVGIKFLDWLAPPLGLRWVDIGCGSGAFTELLLQRVAPSEVQAVDPSEGQLEFARSRAGAAGATFHRGDAMALPFDAGRFDAATMALVLFFVPEPARGIAEMMRVVRPGGSVSAYVWDVARGGLPIEPIRTALREVGIEPASPPSADVSALPALREAFSNSGLLSLETLEITVERPFPDFESYWRAGLMVGSLGEHMASLSGDAINEVRARTRAHLQVNAAGAVLATGTANAIKAVCPNRS
jgi:SAM-dependent methyltransferase